MRTWCWYSVFEKCVKTWLFCCCVLLWYWQWRAKQAWHVHGACLTFGLCGVLQSGIGTGYQEKPCLNPHNQQCPDTAPNKHSKQVRCCNSGRVVNWCFSYLWNCDCLVIVLLIGASLYLLNCDFFVVLLIHLSNLDLLLITASSSVFGILTFYCCWVTHL